MLVSILMVLDRYWLQINFLSVLLKGKVEGNL